MRLLTLPAGLFLHRRHRVSGMRVEIHSFETMNYPTEMIQELESLQHIPPHENVARWDGFALCPQESNVQCLLNGVVLGSLREVIERWKTQDGAVPESNIWEYFTQVCRAIQHLHGEKYLHGHLSTKSAILVTRSPSDPGTVKVAVPLFESIMYETGVRYDRVTIVAPEQLMGELRTYASDVWALGCILYEFASLERPFNADNAYNSVFQLLRNVVEGLYSPLREGQGTSVMRDLAHECLQHEAAQRPSLDQIIRVADQERRRTMFWSRKLHKTLPRRSREWVVMLMCAAARLRSAYSQSATDRHSSLLLAPSLPTEMWLEILTRLNLTELNALLLAAAAGATTDCLYGESSAL